MRHLRWYLSHFKSLEYWVITTMGLAAKMVMTANLTAQIGYLWAEVLGCLAFFGVVTVAVITAKIRQLGRVSRERIRDGEKP